ncbi:hypothetical protein M405DRAFT_814732, partial [Rhizopogon salebrosus TDB-379]
MALSSPMEGVPYTALCSYFHVGVLIWECPPAEDPRPGMIETSRWESDEDDSNICCV